MGIILVDMSLTRKGLHQARAVSSVAGVGAATPGTRGPLLASGAVLAAGTTTTGSGLPGLFSFTPCTFTPLPFTAACVQAGSQAAVVSLNGLNQI